MLVGVVGGMGPLASALFMEMVTNHTKAKKDQEHINMIVLSDVTIPDRTEYILNKSSENPLPKLIENIKKIDQFGADIIVITCNTSHYFYGELIKYTNKKIINMIEETVKKVHAKFGSNIKVGLMATSGTIATGVYKKVLDIYNMEEFVADDETQNKIMKFIYDDVKAGKITSKEEFESVCNYFFENGCDAIITGCTELSVLMEKHKIIDERIVDSMRSLVEVTIELSGKEFV